MKNINMPNYCYKNEEKDHYIFDGRPAVTNPNDQSSNIHKGYFNSSKEFDEFFDDPNSLFEL